MSKEELNTLNNRYEKLLAYISYMKTTKLSKGLNAHDIKVYNASKEELKRLSTLLNKDNEGPKLTYSA